MKIGKSGITYSRRFCLFIACGLLSAVYCSASSEEVPSGQNKIDSLLTLLKKDKEDTNKVNHLNTLAREYYLSGSYDSSMACATTALKLATVIANESHNDSYRAAQKEIITAYNNLGNVNREQGNYPKALDYYFKALKMAEVLGDKKTMAINLGNIGSIYIDKADYQKALDYYLKTLKFNEELGYKKGIASTLGNIGIVYYIQADYPKTLDYYFRALKLDEELENKNGIAIRLGNIGNVYADQGKSEKLKGKSDSLFNKALDYDFRALKLDAELGHINNIAIWFGNIGSVYSSIKKYAESEKYLLDALKIDKEIGAQDGERQDEELLAELYTKTNRYQLALGHYKKAMVLKDTLFSADKNKEITRKEMNYEFEKKEAKVKAEAEKQQAVAEAERKKQQIVLWSVVSCLLLVVVFASFIFRALRTTRKQKLLIEEQKKVVEEKQKEILDSIHYARRIQTALLPTEKYINKTLRRLMKNN